MYWYREWDSNPYRVNTPADFKCEIASNREGKDVTERSDLVEN